ncbi:thymidylate kinase-domain-containing protein [Hypoxylon sp. FL0543]|nr:thymidylate kinase-domain-containing protein [Hypoxylon sp. FL0543]
MASINDLATAATIASSAVALQSSPKPASQDPAHPQPQSTPPAPRSPESGKAAPSASASAGEQWKPVRDREGPEDGDSITVATGAHFVLAAPRIEPLDSAPTHVPAAPVASPPVGRGDEDGDGNGNGDGVVEEAGDAGVDGNGNGNDTSAGAGKEGPADHGEVGDAMDGVEREREKEVKRELEREGPPATPVRGAFIVFEGMDRAGKTTQAKLLQQRCIESGREVRFMRFPDRTTPIGQMIDSYLKGETEVEDHVIHLLFSANRWEAAKKIKAELEAGRTIICDRFYHSGIVYSAAKNIKSLSLSWAKAPEVGLPRPDMVLFLDLEEEVARERGGWGGEVYEKGEMQRRVRDLFWGLSMGDLGSAVGSSKTPRRGDTERLGNGASRAGEGGVTEEGEFRQEEEDIQIVDADLDVESLSEKVWEHVLPRLEAVERGEVGKTVRIVR